MIDTKKEQERDELHRAIWAIADELRGAVDGWDFKNYVLGTMFYRYISENLCNYINDGEIKAGNTEFDFAKMSDEDAEEAKDGLVEEKGFFILPSELFTNVKANAANDENLNETLERVFRHIEESAKGSEAENDFAGLFDDFDVNSNKLGSTVAKRNEKLVKLLNGVALMNLGDVKDHSIDAFGDAYEYLMSMYASNAGKSGGEFYTPADVSELLTRLGTVGKTEINKVYDPACGSGSLLLKVETVLGKEAVRNGYYGQEINITTYNLCRINMFLHDIGFDKFNVACEDTLIAPQHWDEEPFELIVSNPPYSIKWAGDENPLLINDPRFAPAGVLAPKSKADLAFIMHSLSWLASNGTAAIVCFPGIMYRSGAEQKIRKYLVDNNFVDCIIQLPSNLFFGTSIATCIMVMKKNKNDNQTLFVNASNECIKVTNNNKLTPKNIERIVDIFANREEVKHFSHLASYEEVVENDYNLSVSTYVEAEDTREKIDIVKLNAEIELIVAREAVLRDEIATIIAEIEGDSMNEKEMLKELIDNPKKPNVSEWVYEVETFLENINESDTEAWSLIDGIKKQGDVFSRCENLVALLKQLYKRKYDGITLPPIKKRNQIFVAMMFSDVTDSAYENVYKPVVQSLNYSSMRIDEKQFNGSIIGEITTEITDSLALIADLTGNRGGVYYEAGVARGLQLCNHPIKLIFTCSRSFFDDDKVHFDVQGDNIILYSDENDLKNKLTVRLQAVFQEESGR